MTWINGLTLDQVMQIDKICSVLSSFSKPVTVRIVFDEFVGPQFYLPYIKRIAPLAQIVGQLLDSSSVELYTLTQYQKRATEYLSVLGPYVNVWEIGNEINGEWLGAGAAAKALAAHNIMKAAGKKTMLTGYYNCQCEDRNGPMIPWLTQNIDPKLKAEVDYFTISYYEDDCENRIVSNTEWTNVFNQCGQIFPNALLAMGECGTQILAAKKTVMTRYYSMRIAHPRFVGGFFWWYSYGDVFVGNTLRTTFASLMV